MKTKTTKSEKISKVLSVIILIVIVGVLIMALLDRISAQVTQGKGWTADLSGIVDTFPAYEDPFLMKPPDTTFIGRWDGGVDTFIEVDDFLRGAQGPDDRGVNDIEMSQLPHFLEGTTRADLKGFHRWRGMDTPPNYHWMIPEIDYTMTGAIITKREDGIITYQTNNRLYVEKINSIDRHGDISYHGDQILIFYNGDFFIVGSDEVLTTPTEMCGGRACKFCHPNDYRVPGKLNHDMGLHLLDRAVFVSEDPGTGEIIIRIQKRR